MKCSHCREWLDEADMFEPAESEWPNIILYCPECVVLLRLDDNGAPEPDEERSLIAISELAMTTKQEVFN